MSLYPKSFGSYNFCARTNILNEVKGFDIDYRFASGEDNDLSYKIYNRGFKILFALDVLVEHKRSMTLRKYIEEQFQHGFWRVKMYMDHPQMTLGDNYTFWKDIFEPAIVLVIIFSLTMSLFLLLWPYSSWLSNLSLVFLFFLEVFYGILITKNLKEGFYFSSVMFLRAFARTFGFLCGIFFFPFKILADKHSKKIK